MATNHNNLSRRSLLGGLAVIGAVATPVAGATIAKAMQQPDRRAWDKTLAEFRRFDARHDALIDAYSEAEGAWDRACPRIDRYFDKYRLGIGMDRKRVVESLAHYNWSQGLSGKPEIAVQATADEFMAYQAKHVETKRACGVERIDRELSAVGDDWGEARDTLMAVPAPDASALLIKMEAGMMSGNDDHRESILTDARRLLSNGRA